jgi:putative CocE/NonD family hydrolase
MAEKAWNVPGVSIYENTMVQMRDGVHLATDIYLPSDGEFWPVLFERTPYNKTGTNHADRTEKIASPISKPEIAMQLAQAGYAVVIQDCRGRFHSEGEFKKYVNEGEDGYDTLSWILQQPWCNGRIGTFGLSYGAHVQTALAALGPPGLSALWMDSGGFSSAFHSGIRQGGAFELKQATWAYRHALLSPKTKADPVRRAALEAVDIAEAFNHTPWDFGTSPVAAAPEYESYLLELWRAGLFDDYWQQNGLCLYDSYNQFSDVPMVFISSWYDPYARAAAENFTALASPKSAPVRLILGPWTHGQRSVTYSGDVDFGPQSLFDHQFPPDYHTFRQYWFDYALADSGSRSATNPLPDPVHYFVMGGGSGLKTPDGRLDHGGEWRASDCWPPRAATFTPYFLNRSGTLSPDHPDRAQTSLAYRYDPASPVPTHGGATASGAPVMEAGAFDQEKSRSDVLYFETAPLDEPIDVIGPIKLVLFVSSDCPDTDFTFKLIDVSPPNADFPQGFAMNLTHGILRARYREGFDREAFLSAGQVYRLEIEGFPTANRFMPGHRIRLDVSSSNFPHFDKNPNSGEPEGFAQNPRVARNQVYVDDHHPSHIILPIIPAKPQT